MQHKFTNSLINETSPYLLQHAHNPVNWFAWGDEALSKAKTENKVILVSIGYSACHWCHVMERESFENELVAQVMNEHFVNIKIDREERPDLDHIYMDAIQAITGSGGWPLNVFLTPGAKPFFGGTYFPPVKAFNRSSWTEILQTISHAWRERQDEIESQAEHLTEHLQKSSGFVQTNNDISTRNNDGLITTEHCDSMFSTIMKSADTQWGGFGKAPKFPQTFTIQYLLQYHYFTGNKEALEQALLSIDKMLTGGIYDHIGGGLARYSTDNEWLVPHFEKMLYDNALLISILCDAYQLTAEKKYEDAIRKTILFTTRELLNSEGGFYAALDADSEGEEGKYYVWQKAEADQLLGDDSELFCAFFDVTEPGNWEEKNILRMLIPADVFAKERGLDKDEFLQTMEQCLRKLSLQRDTRIKPSLDDKIILGWNALMLKAFAKAGIVLQDESYRNIAETNFKFLMKNLKDNNSSVGLFHTYKNGIAKYPAFLDDYANLVAACIELYKATFNEYYIKNAYDLCDYVIENFSDNESILFFFTHLGQKDVIVRKKEIYDGAMPSGNSVMAENLYKLSLIYDKPQWGTRAGKMWEVISPAIIQYPGSFAIWASVILQQIAGMIEIAVISMDFLPISRKILLNFIPNMILLSSQKENNNFPLLANKTGTSDTRIYFCKNFTCLAPFSDADSLLREIYKTNKITG
ncbi:MAG: thioredoxin domain-containing protein [Ferruginibacter sp.]|nr:thioredoxin domain-containing protein [Ferruginibacter sp.]